MQNKLVYGIHDKPAFSKMLIFALQQLLAIMAATITVPIMVGQMTGIQLSISAALVGAGVGTIVYQLFTKFRSPVFLGSSFAFIGPMAAAISGAASMSAGFLGLLIGAVMAGIVYVVIALVVKYAGISWINKLMPPAVIGSTVAIIGLSLAGAAINDVFSYGPIDSASGAFIMSGNAWISLVCALVTFTVVTLCSTYGKKTVKLIPFIIGILAGYAVALVFTVIGYVANADALKIIDFSPFRALVADGVSLTTFIDFPDLTFVEAFRGFGDLTGSHLATIAVAYVPVAFVVFAEHIADHKNLSSIIGTDLIENPGLHRTLLGDGVGSMAGAFFGGCPNTTYGESVGCVAITKNASVCTITSAAIMSVAVAFLSPLVAFLDSIPGCIMGGVCITLYGFIAVSGLKMLQKVNLEDNANLFTVSAVLIAGIGGMAMKIGPVVITSTACALILGILTNILLNKFKKPESCDSEKGENE